VGTERGKKSKQAVEVRVFGSARGMRAYDRQDEDRVIDAVVQGVLPKAKADYSSVSVKIRRGVDGAPDHLVAYMLRKDTYTADVVKVVVDKNYAVKEIEENYDDSADVDEDEEARGVGTGASQSYAGPYDLVVGTPVPNIPTADAAVDYLYNLAISYGLTAWKLKGAQATVAAYKQHLTSGVRAFVNIGHGFNGGIVLYDNTLPANWFQALAPDALEPAVIYFNSCQVSNPPLKLAIMAAGARTFVGGKTNLLIGASENVCKCFWTTALGNTKTMQDSLTNCEAANYPNPGAHEISGDLGKFSAGEAMIFQHIFLRGVHRHIIGAERNLNHPDDPSMNDQMSSFVVVSGVWRFYQHAEYITPLGGKYGPGVYPWVGLAGILNDQVSSLRQIKS